MNAGAPLRRLVENPVVLEGLKPRPGVIHPHHPLLKLDHAWQVGNRRAVKVPASEEGIRRLHELTKRPVPTLAADLHGSAWRALLERPTIQLAMLDPDEQERTAHDMAGHASVPAARFVRLVIGAVICEVSLRYGTSDGLSCEPVCGIADVIVRRDEDGTPTHLWASAEWHASSGDVLEALERFWPQLQATERGSVTASPDSSAGRRRHAKSVRPGRPKATKRVMVVVPDYPVPDEPADWNQAVAAMGRLIGLDVIAVRPNVHKQTDIESVARALSSTPPSLLLIAGAEPKDTTKLVDAYAAASTGPRVEHIAPGLDGSAVLREVRAGLLRVAGIGVGLMAVSGTPRQSRRDGHAPTIASLPDFPIKDEGRSGRHGNVRVVEDRATGNWYSRDITRHGANQTEEYGDAQYKIFREQSGYLILQSSADQQGYVIDNKHESRRYGHINMKDVDWKS